MTDSLVVCAFFLLIFMPCLLAFAGGEYPDSAMNGVLYMDKGHRRRNAAERVAPLQPMELELAEGFEIRSFPKGLSQRRIVVRDSEHGVKLTIAQVRAAAAELVRLGGEFAAQEFALAVAAVASVKKTVEEAAREAMEAAHNAYAWFAWGDGLVPEQPTPPRTAPRRVADRMWVEVQQAA